MNRTIKYVLSIIATVLLLISVSGCGSSSDPSASSIKLESGKVVSFAEDIAGGGENGWSIPDNGGTWSQADSAILNLEYDKSWNNGLNLVLSLMSFVNVQNPNVTVSVKANDEFVKELNFDEAKPSEEVSIDISKDILSKKVEE